MATLAWEMVAAIGILIGMVLGMSWMMIRLDREDWNNAWPDQRDE